MSIPKKIDMPDVPRFLFAPDASEDELYILCSDPLSLIWVRQTTPAQLYILEGPQEEKLLREVATWYRKTQGEMQDFN